MGQAPLAAPGLVIPPGRAAGLSCQHRSALAALQSCLQAAAAAAAPASAKTAFSEVTPQIAFLDKRRSVFCPLCNNSSLCFFFPSAFIINNYIRTCPSLGKGSFCLVVSDCCQTAKTQNKPSQRREPGPSLAAATFTAICQPSCLLLPPTSNAAELPKHFCPTQSSG